MGKLRGFLDIGRQDFEHREKGQRLRDFKAVELQHGENAITRQAARCMDCGTPFCHAYGCPVSNIIPEFNEFVHRGMWSQALDILLSTNNFPEFTGRICPAPCEAACVAGLAVEPVAIRHIELAIIEKGFESGLMDTSPPASRLEKGVAVVGSGPAGLAAADTLNRAGCRVTVFEDAFKAGGILRYGIPDFKLEKWVVNRRVKLMEEQGVIFETGVTVGDDISWRYLSRHFHAVCLACGAREPRDLNIPGRDYTGIHFAMDYLTQQNKRLAGEPVDPKEAIHARGKKVVIIGGGDTGSDCLGTALRQGAGSVWQVEILPKPPPQRSEETPWPMWPRILRKTHAHEEGGEVLWATVTREFLGEGGSVKKLRCARVSWETAENGGTPVPMDISGSEFEMEADLVLLAMGFVGPGRNRLVEDLGLVLDNRGNVKVDNRQMTSAEGFFAAGDMSLGQSLAVRAIADGRRAARGIAAFLGRG